MAVLTDVADAITAEINAQTWTAATRVVATRQNVPRLSREDSDAIQVTVTPKERTTEAITRGKSKDTLVFYVGIQRHLQDDSNDETDALIGLGEAIQAYFDRGLPLTTYPTTVCEETSFGSDTETPWLGIQDQDQLLLYTGIVRLTFRVHR